MSEIRHLHTRRKECNSLADGRHEGAQKNTLLSVDRYYKFKFSRSTN